MVLTLADRPSWSILFVFAAISGAMRLARRDAALWIAALHGARRRRGNVSTRPTSATTISLIGATTLAIGFMMFALPAAHGAQRRAASTAREDVARLAVAEERLRFARDLHDLLGHSLSVIARQGRARRAAARSATRRAAAEHVTDVKDVARSALGEVREAVCGYRRPTLAGELAGARMALEAAGIERRARGPDVRAAARGRGGARLGRARGHDERHPPQRRAQLPHRRPARARARERRDRRRRARAVDAGDGAGNGLAGLRERAEQLAGALEAGPAPDGGFRLRVTRAAPAARDMIRILHRRGPGMVREAIASLLDLEDDLEVVAQVGRGDEVLAAARRGAARRRAARHRDAGRDRPRGARRARARAARPAASSS